METEDSAVRAILELDGQSVMPRSGDHEHAYAARSETPPAHRSTVHDQDGNRWSGGRSTAAGGPAAVSGVIP